MIKPSAAALACILTTTLASAQMKPRQEVPKVQLPATMNNGAVQITPAQDPNSQIAKVKRISRDEATKLVKAGKAIFVDVRSKGTFDTGHIKGALSIPGSQLLDRLKELPAGKMIITYCACHAEETAALAVLRLNAHGITNAAALTGGWNEWIALGLPNEKTR